MTCLNNIVPQLLDPQISSTDSLGGIAPGKSKLDSWGAPQSEIDEVLTPGMLDAAPHFSLERGVRFLCNFDILELFISRGVEVWLISLNFSLKMDLGIE